MNRNGDWVESGDEVTDPEVEAAELKIEEFCYGSKCEAPETARLQIRVGYDDGFLYQVGGYAEYAEEYIDEAFTHVQASYCHPSLGTKITIERMGKPKHYEGKELQATEDKLIEMYDITKEDLRGADLMFYIGYEYEQHGTIGLAYTGRICITGDQYKQSINEWRSTTAQAGFVSSK